MRRIRASINLISIAACAAALILPQVAHARSAVNYAKLRVAGAWVNVVTADMNVPSIRLTPVVARRGIGTSESFRSIMRRMRPAAAINGTFFDTRTLRPTGDIVIGGQLVFKGDIGTAVAVDYDNKVTFIPSRRSDLYNWSNYEHVLVAGPTLLLRGQKVVQPRDEGFRSGVHYSKRRRAAVGLTDHNKLVFVTTSGGMYLSKLAKIMRSLGCTDAAVLDGGSSAGLYCKGKLIMNPSRGMTNCLLIYDDLSSYENHRGSLYPLDRYTQAPSTGS